MFDLPLHPAIVHIPIGVGLLTPAIALVALARAWRAQHLRASGWVLVVMAQLTTVAGGIAAARTGEEDEERVERVVAESFIEEHEERAEAFNVMAGVAALAGVLGLALQGKGARAAAALAVALSVAAAVQGFRTGHSGGSLVYKHGAASAHSARTGAPDADTHGD